MFDDYTVEIPERLDQLTARLYDVRRLGLVEAILNANPGLAAEGEPLTPGRVLRVPREASTVAQTEVIRLWT